MTPFVGILHISFPDSFFPSKFPSLCLWWELPRNSGYTSTAKGRVFWRCCLPWGWKHPQHHHENGFRWTGLLSCPNLSHEQDFQPKLMPWSCKSSHSGGLQGLCWSPHMAASSCGWCQLRDSDLHLATSADFVAHFTWPGESPRLLPDLQSEENPQSNSSHPTRESKGRDKLPNSLDPQHTPRFRSPNCPLCMRVSLSPAFLEEEPAYSFWDEIWVLAGNVWLQGSLLISSLDKIASCFPSFSSHCHPTLSWQVSFPQAPSLHLVLQSWDM